MPFVNMSRSDDGDYFSDGLAEELINVLSKIRGLRVAARTSAFSFKGSQSTVREIGNALNVASILEGSVRIAGKRVRISVQLINVSDGYHLWTETYDRTMDDIFAVQDDIAQSVVEELRPTLLGETQAPVRLESELKEAVRGRATDPEAQRLMMLGRYFLDRTTQEDTTKAIGYFREALDLDFGYALCWAELARAYAIEAGRAWVPVNEGFDRSRDAARRSLALEPDLGEGHALLGRILATHDWDLKGAEAAYRRAVELAPGNSSVLDGAGVLAYKLGDFERALELIRRVLRQDPLSAAFWHNFGLICHAAGKLAESENAYHRALELVPQRLVSNALLAVVLMDQGRLGEAVQQAQLEPNEMWRAWALAITYHASGQEELSRSELDKVLEHFRGGNAYQIAEVHAARSDANEAFAWLEKAYAERDTGLTHVRVDPRMRALQSDARWPELIKKIGFET